ncbi:MAG: hypothetical protein ACLQUZ_09250 [Rhizomicrobium sp.]
MRTLLLPCAGRSSRYPGVRPKWMLTLPDGALALQRAANSVPSDAYERVVIAIRADHDASYGCRDLLRRAFGQSAEIVVLDRDTRGPADTVAHMIRQADITGAIAIKDADSFFDPAPLPDCSFASVVDVRTAPRMANIGAKSFAVVDDNGNVVEMVEKSLASNHVCVGLYGCADARLFVEHFLEISRTKVRAELFVSHVLSSAIRACVSVVPHHVTNLVDVGTLEDWRRYVRSRGTIVCDIDGVVFKNQSQYFRPYWDDPEEPIDANVATLREWQENGAQLVFMTARPEAYRAQTQAALAGLGLDAHALIMNCHHGRRLLINDHAASNPFPAAVGVSVQRNEATLGDYLRDWR